jgi:hypothetical protein
MEKYLKGLGLAQPQGLGRSVRFSLTAGFSEVQGHNGESLTKL